MNSKLHIAAAAAAALLIVSALWGWQQSQAAAQALERARKAEGALMRATEVRDCAAWEQLEQDAALLAGELKETDRKTASTRFRETLRRLKNRYGYPQLGNEP
jgi:Flp pilus assembly protein TadB